MADPAAAAANSREIRVFISSTFRDFMEERRLLATHVFPEINRRARERGVELVEVDLRWGVTQKQVEDGHALEIYLKEIERCRPYFIGMLGDSYGSITPTERQLLTAAPELLELLEKRQWLAGQLGEISYTALEIGHSLDLLRDQQLQGRAFFYFRDSAWSAPKADAGEAGWRSDDPAERQKLELLRSRIRSSGHPLVEGLQSPQAIADRIKEDLWALIDRQFPEGEQPDALEREERKHADYRRSRTRPGEYVGGEGYIQRLERWIEDGQQHILITGESGSGKSALLANWMERHSQSHPADVVYAHHLGCTNDANALRPLLGRLIDTASKQLLEADVIGEALAVPEDWWELVAKVAKTLQALGHWCQQQGKRWIWVLDGLDRLDPDDQQALPWLPLNLPDGVQVVASALACPAQEILKERDYTTLTIQPLAQAEQEQLIQRYLQRYTKELDGGLRQQILAHRLAGSPLFLKVLLEELRQCGRHDTLKQQLDFYLSSQSVDDLYERVLERLETDGSGEAVRKVMTSLWASRAGLTETELLDITDLKPFQWAPIDLALEKAFGRNSNRLVFDHDYLRIAVGGRYLRTEKQQRQAHSELADWYQDREGWNERDSEELPWQLQHASRLEDLRNLLLVPEVLACLQWDLGSREIINYWQIAKGNITSELDELIEEAVQEKIDEQDDELHESIWLLSQLSDLLYAMGMNREPLLRISKLLLDQQYLKDDQREFYLARYSGILSQLGRHDESIDLMRKELDATSLGSDQFSLGLAQFHLALSLHHRAKRKDLEEAATVYKESLENISGKTGKNHPLYIDVLSNYATLLSSLKKYKKAEDSFQEVVSAEIFTRGANSPELASALMNLSICLFEQNQLDASLERANQAIDILHASLGPAHPDTLEAKASYSKILMKAHRKNEALEHSREAAASLAAILGEDHPTTIYAYEKLAEIEFQCLKIIPALKSLRKAFANNRFTGSW